MLGSDNSAAAQVHSYLAAACYLSGFLFISQQCTLTGMNQQFCKQYMPQAFQRLAKLAHPAHHQLLP
jgi:hypothetical protein